MAIPEAWSHVGACLGAERRFDPEDVAACAKSDSVVIDAARNLSKWLAENPGPPALGEIHAKIAAAAAATDAGFTPRVAALQRGDQSAFNDSMNAAFNGLGQFCDPMKDIGAIDSVEQWPAVEC